MTCQCIAHTCTEQALASTRLCGTCSVCANMGGDCAAPDLVVDFTRAPSRADYVDNSVEQVDAAIEDSGLV